MDLSVRDVHDLGLGVRVEVAEGVQAIGKRQILVANRAVGVIDRVAGDNLGRERLVDIGDERERALDRSATSGPAPHQRSGVIERGASEDDIGLGVRVQVDDGRPSPLSGGEQVHVGSRPLVRAVVLEGHEQTLPVVPSEDLRQSVEIDVSHRDLTERSEPEIGIGDGDELGAVDPADDPQHAVGPREVILPVGHEHDIGNTVRSHCHPTIILIPSKGSRS